MRVKIFLLGMLLFFCPLIGHAETEYSTEEKELVSVLFQGDVANGITDNISFDVICTDAEGDAFSVNLMRINKFQARETIATGNYLITNIDTYNKDYSVEDIPFTVDVSDTGSAKLVTVKVGEGAKDEEINTSFSSDRGATPKPTITPTKNTTMNSIPDKNNTTAVENASNDTDTAKIIKYCLVGLVICSIYFGFRKLKNMWHK